MQTRIIYTGPLISSRQNEFQGECSGMSNIKIHEIRAQDNTLTRNFRTCYTYTNLLSAIHISDVANAVIKRILSC